jgi:hypothetical protein
MTQFRIQAMPSTMIVGDAFFDTSPMADVAVPERVELPQKMALLFGRQRFC